MTVSAIGFSAWAIGGSWGAVDDEDRSTSRFEPDDHRAFNRNGEAFDKGETFPGIPYDAGLEAVEGCGRWFRQERRSRSSRCGGS